MAAVLCNGIGALCNGLCTVLALPFQVCGKCCQGLGDACGGCCRGCTKLCGLVFCQSPFTPYIITTLALQIGPIIWSLLTVLDPAPDNECGFLNMWMYVTGLFAVAHIVGAFYIALSMARDLNDPSPDNSSNNNNSTTYGTGQQSQRASASQQQQQQQGASSSSSQGGGGGKYLWEYVADLFAPNDTNISNSNNQPPPPEPPRNRGGSNSWKRLGHLMCHDVGVACYMLVFLAWFVWLPVGISAKASSANDDDDEDCERVADAVQSCVICGFIYLLLVAASFCCSVVFLKV